MSIKQRIEELISYSELSATEFAEKIDVQRSSISHILSGRNKPSLDFLMKVKEAFPKISWEWLIDGKGDMEIVLQNKEEEKRTPLPDLFSFVAQEDNEEVSTPYTNNFPNLRELPIEKKIKSESIQAKEILEKKENLPADSKSTKIQKIILLYEDGRFESFVP